MSIPNWPQTKEASSGDSAMFFRRQRVDRRGTMRISGPELRRGRWDVLLQVPDGRVVFLHLRQQPLDRLRVGSERSMWQRQIQRLACPGGHRPHADRLRS